AGVGECASGVRSEVSPGSTPPVFDLTWTAGSASAAMIGACAPNISNAARIASDRLIAFSFEFDPELPFRRRDEGSSIPFGLTRNLGASPGSGQTRFLP